MLKCTYNFKKRRGGGKMEVKYQRIAEELRNKIEQKEYPIHTPIPSEAALQKEYEVSRHTIRQAIAVLVNEGYLRKEKGSGTYVEANANQAPKSSNENKTIGVITTYVSDYIFPSIIRGIEKTLGEQGFSLLLSSTNNDYQREKECLEQMLQQQVQGLIVEPTKSNQFNPNLGFYLDLKAKGIPVLMINTGYEELDFPKICVDDTQGGFLATEALIKKGHRELLLFTKIDDLQGKYRMKGFIKACEQSKVPLVSERLLTYTTETKEEKLAELLATVQEQQVTGVVCYNDEIAYEFMQLAAKHQLEIPEMLSLVGNDNSMLSQMGVVQLTTVTHPQEELGIAAAQQMIGAVRFGKPLQDKIYEPKLIERDSISNRKN